MTHPLHHHVENNGPADWQSTLIYSRSSVLDFCKASTWIGLTFVVPIDTIDYLTQKRNLYSLQLLLRGWLLGVAALALAAWIEPLLFYCLVWSRVFSGCTSYALIRRWHALHDPDRPHDVAGANNNLAHYLHHKRPRVHLWDIERLARSQVMPHELVLFTRNASQGIGFWRLQGLLWAKTFGHARAFLIVATSQHATATHAGMPSDAGRSLSTSMIAALVRPCVPEKRWEFVSRLDDCLSNLVGQIAAATR